MRVDANIQDGDVLLERVDSIAMAATADGDHRCSRAQCASRCVFVGCRASALASSLIEGLSFEALIAEKVFDGNAIIADHDRHGRSGLISQHQPRAYHGGCDMDQAGEALIHLVASHDDLFELVMFFEEGFDRMPATHTSQFDFMGSATTAVSQQQEKWFGQGYP